MTGEKSGKKRGSAEEREEREDDMRRGE